MAEEEMKKDPVLLVFDFDHTVISDDADVSVADLSPGALPDSVLALKEDQWTEHMGALFSHLHKQGVSPEDIQRHMQSLPLTEGMSDLFEHIRGDTCQYEAIIISDANSVFINCLLKYYNLSGLISRVFTNPAKFDANGCLVIERYHTQDWCPLSRVNMCKGHILENYIAQRKEEGVKYSHVIYIGDGSNDLCPGLKLNAQDYLMVRKGFSLWKKLEEMRLKPNKENPAKVVATVVGWDSAVEIVTFLKNIVADSGS